MGSTPSDTQWDKATWGRPAGNASHYIVSDFSAMKWSKLSDFFLLEAPITYPASCFKPKHFTARKSFKCVEILVSQWRLLKQHIISTLPASRTSCFNIPGVSTHITGKPFSCMLPEDLHFQPFGRERLILVWLWWTQSGCWHCEPQFS